MGVADEVQQRLSVRHAVLHGGNSQTQRGKRTRACVAGWGRPRCGRRPQEIAHLVVGGLGEVPVLLAHREER